MSSPVLRTEEGPLVWTVVMIESIHFGGTKILLHKAHLDVLYALRSITFENHF